MRFLREQEINNAGSAKGKMFRAVLRTICISSVKVYVQVRERVTLAWIKDCELVAKYFFSFVFMITCTEFETTTSPPFRMSLEGKVIAITGGASGIGLATANLVSSRGATVCLCDWDLAAISAAESHFTTLKVPFSVTQVDVSKRPEVDNWVNGIVEKFGRLDGAVNSAGVIGKHHGLTQITELEDEEWHRIISINLTGMMYCLRAELRKISDGGSIVNLSSIQGVMGKPSFPLKASGMFIYSEKQVSQALQRMSPASME